MRNHSCLLTALWATAFLLPSTSPADQKTFTNSIGMKFVLIPAGQFVMGSPESEKNRDGDEQQHRVRITKPFYLGVHEVTQEQYQRVMGENFSLFKGTNLPVEKVSWAEAVAFCERLRIKDGKVYRLPTEAQWEYACRAGTTTAFHYGDSLGSAQANFDGNSPYGDAAKGPNLQRTTAVGSYAPNKWGLYDMHGNVYEWCQDWYDHSYYARSAREDPRGPPRGFSRVYRGGCWLDRAELCRSAYRSGFVPTARFSNLGFRVSLVLPKE